MTKESVDEESRLLVGVSGDNVKSDQFILTSFPRFPSSDQPHGAKIYTIIVVTIVGLLCVCTSYISYASTAMSECWKLLIVPCTVCAKSGIEVTGNLEHRHFCCPQWDHVRKVLQR